MDGEQASDDGSRREGMVESSPMNGPVSGLRLVFIVRELHVQCLVLCLCERVNG